MTVSVDDQTVLQTVVYKMMSIFIYNKCKHFLFIFINIYDVQMYRKSNYHQNKQLNIYFEIAFSYDM